MPEQLVELIKIKDNPYQGRKIYEDIEALGRSIAQYGLQELPKARTNGKGYQLKFGHRRREAFRWLAANWQAQNLPDRYSGYTVMPLDIEELTDEQMFEGAVIENEHRKNLNPIEQAEMMLVYRDQFKKTSEEIGELFGVSGATVRGIIRLRELPEPVKEKVATGEISQGAARKLLTIARVDESQVKQAALNIVSGMSSEEALDEAMRKSDSAFVMWFGWRNEAPLAGEHLWRIDLQPDKFPMKHLPTLTVKDAIKALEADDSDDAMITTIMNVVNGAPGAITVEQYMDTNPQYADWVERIKQLITPTACSACPFHSVSDKQHHCGFKPCHQRKKKAWLASETLRVSKKLNIPVYNPAADGKTILILSKNETAHAKLVKDGHAAIRVQPFINEYSQNAWTDSHLARLILTGEKVKALKEQKEKAADREQSNRVDHEREWQLQRERANAADRFFNEIASKPFAIVFKDFDHIPVLVTLTRSNRPKKDAKKADVLAALRWQLAKRALDNLSGYDWDLRHKGPVAVAKFLQGVAKEWGVKLPDDYLEIAKKFEPVSAETKKGKSK